MTPKRLCSIIALLGILALVFIFLNHPKTVDHESAGSAPPPRPPKSVSDPDPQRLERLRQEAKESFQERAKKQESNGVTQHTSYRLFGEGGRLTSAAAEAAQLDLEEKQRAAEAVAKVWNEANDEILKRGILNSRESNPEKKIAVYDFSAASDRGQGTLDKLKSELTQAVGAQKAAVLAESFSPDDAFGYFGKEDIKVKLNYEDQDPNNQTLEIEYFNADSGKQVMRASTNAAVFGQKFGINFPIPE